MNRFLLFLCFLCIPWAARGQVAYDWLYWFDDDDAHRHTGVSQGESFRIDTEVGELSEGFHTLHVQVADTAGRFSPPHATLFCHIPDKTITALYYWFDNDVEHVYESASTGGHYTIDVKMLEPGLHYVYCQAKDAKGVMTDVSRAVFYRQMLNNALKWTYWFDEDGQTTTVENPGEAVLIDVSHLDDGFHTIHSQVSETSVSEVVSRMFIKVPQTEGVADMTCICTVDGKLVAQENVPAAGGIMHWQMNVDSIDVGVHRASFQVITPSGVASNIADCFFLRAITDREIGTMKCVYSLDNFHTQSQAGTMSNGLFHFDLDVSALEDGLHRIAYMLISEQGITTSQKTAYFWKAPLGGDGIAQYDYWLNNDEEHTHKVKLDKRENPFKLVSLLPVETQPIRSSCFHFEVKAGQPMIYAKNDLHLRFYDTSTREVSQTKQFVDYQVGQEVEPVGELQAKQTFAKVSENDIRWYTMQAAPGDTAAFRLSQPATLQVFAPSGKEVFKTSESAAVQWGGIHTWENGTYYVAVHDVTGSQSNMTLDYMHMDKYNVVNWDVHTVGNGGCSTITIDGNGFRDLYAVDLYTAQGDTIQSSTICHTSDANVSITFNFSNAKTGKYHAIFHFSGEDKMLANMLTVEEAKWIDLAVDVKYPSTFLRGTSTTFTITVTNNGNATAYNVPMEIYLQSGNSFGDIQSVTIKDENGVTLNKRQIDIADRDSIDGETLSYLIDFISSLNDKSSFLVIKDSVYGEYGYTDQLITIPPYSNVKLCVDVKSQASVMLKVRIPSDWMTVHTTPSVAYMPRKANPLKRDWCCEKEAWECKVELWANVIGMIPVAGCASGLVDIGTYTTFEIACADGYSLGTKELDFYNSLANDASKRKSLIGKGINGLIGCVSGAIGKSIAALAKKLSAAKKARSAAWAAYGKASVAADEAENTAAFCRNKAEDFWSKGDYSNYEIWNKAAEDASSKARNFSQEASKYYREQQELGQLIGEIERQIDDTKKQLSEIISAIKNGVSAISGNSECTKKWNYAMSTCPPDPNGGSSTPVTPSDPNDIYGYHAESGSKFIADSVARVNYTIEFENDTTLAMASAHTIVIRDTLDSRYFDLNEFLPTGIKLGGHDVFLADADVTTKNGKTTFIKTIDVRPAINAIAQVEGAFDSHTGIAEWRFTSLDPMTMEPTDDLMQGILPVNYDGTSGIGEVMFEIGMKQGKSDGTEIDNRASIVFDYEEAILTPTWTNIVDGTAPESRVIGAELASDTTAIVSIQANDVLSGVWRYDVYVQYGTGSAWWKAAENVPADTTATVKIYEGMDHGFYVVLTDSAGNVERKQAMREQTLNLSSTVRGDVNGDGQVGIADIVAVTGYMAGTNSNVSLAAADVNGDGQVGIADIVAITDIMAGTANMTSRHKTYFVKRKEYKQQWEQSKQ